MVKVVDSIQYHVWSDALHARELARPTESPWDRGAYVRWAIQTAWTAFEKVCTDVMEAKGLGMRFRERFDEALDAKGLSRVDWGRGIWQQLMQVYGVRKEFVHVVPTICQARLMTPLDEAEKAIAVLREGIMEVWDLVGQPRPAWAADDTDRGWQGNRMGPSATLNLHSVPAGVQPDDPMAVRITYVLRDRKRLSEVAPPGTPQGRLLDQLLGALNSPVDAVRAYCGTELLEERRTSLR